MDEFQWCGCPNRAQRGLWYSSLKDVAPLATSHKGLTVLSHHGPPKCLLCKGQHPLLALMAGVMMNPIESCMKLISRDQKDQDYLRFPFWHGADLKQPFTQDEAVTNAEEGVALLSLHVVAQVFPQQGISLLKWCILACMERLPACS